MYNPIVKLFLLLCCLSLLLAACLHEPTETNGLTSRSKNLRIFQDADSIVYTVQATASLVEEDPVSPGTILIAVQEVDFSGNPKFVTLSGKIITQETINTVVIYKDELGNQVGGDELVGIKPLLNCTSLENTINSPCLEDVYLSGSLVVTWTKVPDIVEPLTSTAIAVMEETWQLQLTETDENFNVIGMTPRIVETTSRYISQTADGLNKGELFVHAYATPVVGVYDWASERDLNQNTVIRKAKSDPSPIDTSGERIVIKYDIDSNCNSNCNYVAAAEKNMTYHLNNETLTLGKLGNFSVLYITLSGNVERRPVNAVGPIEMGYDIFSNCDSDIPGVSFNKTAVRYAGAIAMYPDVGPLKFIYNCSAEYLLSYGTQTDVRVGTSIHIEATMSSTNIYYGAN